MLACAASAHFKSAVADRRARRGKGQAEYLTFSLKRRARERLPGRRRRRAKAPTRLDGAELGKIEMEYSRVVGRRAASGTR